MKAFTKTVEWTTLCVLVAACGDSAGGAGSIGSASDGGSSTSRGTTSIEATMTGPTEGSASTSGSATIGTDGGSNSDSQASNTASNTATDSDATTDASTTGAAPFCGDGAVDADEQCDDGPDIGPGQACKADCTANVCGDGDQGPGEVCDNGPENADDKLCKSDCTLASCGDGVVQPGEGCDDGNATDDDACTNACVPVGCGDGVVKPPEACDDGNEVDTDDCLSTCALAVCGDGFAQAGVEACDDGNQVANDACTNACALPACDDKIKNSAETDIDCGGMSCPKCGPGQNCLVDSDCEVGACSEMVCVVQSCKQILMGDPAATSGKYNVDLDGGGPLQPLDVYCDMTTDNGGWTVFYGKSAIDNELPIVSNTDALANDPLNFKTYSMNRARKLAIAAGATETLFVRKDLKWIKADIPAFDATLLVANSTFKKATTLTANDATTAQGFLGWANHSFNGGGDFGLSRNPDGQTPCNTTTVLGFDHHYHPYWMLNCNCDRQYLYSYSNGLADGDATYNANTALGSWTVTATCISTEGGGIELYAAMR